MSSTSLLRQNHLQTVSIACSSVTRGFRTAADALAAARLSSPRSKAWFNASQNFESIASS
jgi:hypothetical protein